MSYSANPVVAAADIGYGNCKIIGGFANSQEAKEFVLPSGAAPLDAMPRRSDNTADLKGGEQVLINGTPWAAGVEQLHIQNRARMTHEEYPRTREYEALYLAGLSRLGLKRIDVLVTGLPVNQFYSDAGEALRSDMIAMMRGRKVINDEMSVEVGQVHIIPQPMGTFFGLACEPERAAMVTQDQLRTLVIDPGYFSVDSVLMSGKSVLNQFSGTSNLATSVILERAAAAMTKELGRTITSDQLDAAQRRQSDTIQVGYDRQYEYLPALKLAAATVTDAVVGKLKTTLRNAGAVDLIVLTGGGSWLYEESLRAAFPNTDFALPKDMVLGNARGYLAVANIAASRAGRRAAAA